MTIRSHVYLLEFKDRVGAKETVVNGSRNQDVNRHLERETVNAYKQNTYKMPRKVKKTAQYSQEEDTTEKNFRDFQQDSGKSYLALIFSMKGNRLSVFRWKILLYCSIYFIYD